jgi:hypothetical protein
MSLGEDVPHVAGPPISAVDRVPQCMHAAMSHAPAWCAHLSGEARDRAIGVFADTVMMLVGVLPRAATI